MTEEHRRVEASTGTPQTWRLWGPYLSERAWGGNEAPLHADLARLALTSRGRVLARCRRGLSTAPQREGEQQRGRSKGMLHWLTGGQLTATGSSEQTAIPSPRAP